MIGKQLGPYQVLDKLGEGGMGEVYRARDTKLSRDVALKILPEIFALDPDRLARFEREAHVLASLNHPNIGAIYGLEESTSAGSEHAPSTSSGQVRALVLELVEGPTLADLIAASDAHGADGSRGLEPDEAVRIARQIAAALEAAHEAGVIHRDLKPANVKVRPDGTVKVLDFGLAKAMGTVESALSRVSVAPTVTSPALMTGTGTIVGTAAYMSPEQAKGRPIDRRADTWAFGCVLYEMLTGRRPFDGEDVTDTIAAVVRAEPNWDALPARVSPAIRTLLQRCLIKDPRERLSDASTALFVLKEAASLTAIYPPVAQIDTAVGGPSASGRFFVAAAVTLLAAAGVGAAAAWLVTRPGPPRVTKLQLIPVDVSTTASFSELTISPDASRIVYVNRAGIVVRPLGHLNALVIPLAGARRPFVSPDGQSIGFFDTSRGFIRRVAITGGPARDIVPAAAGSRGAAWLPNRTIVFGTADVTTGLLQTSEDGGEVTVLTRPDREHGEIDHMWPQPLPGSRAVLFTIVSGPGPDARQVAVFDLSTRKTTRLFRGSDARYARGGYLIYEEGGALSAVRFDLNRRTVLGQPQAILDSVAVGPSSISPMNAAVANDGTLVYLPGGTVTASQLVWVDRHGVETPLKAPSRTYFHVRISPDNSSVAVYINDQELDIWVSPLANPSLMRVTTDPFFDGFPVWLPDGRHMAFSSSREGTNRDLFRQPIDGTSAAESLSNSPTRKDANSVTRDGRLVFTENSPATSDDVMIMEDLDGARRIRPLAQTTATERNGEVSPDERWLAYQSNRSGPFEIYVRPFTGTGSGPEKLASVGGGTRPLWSRDGRELFYFAPDGSLMRVGVGLGTGWNATAPTKLLEPRYNAGNETLTGRTYDISKDGQRFLMIKSDLPDNASEPVSFIVVQHFDEELKARVK